MKKTITIQLDEKLEKDAMELFKELNLDISKAFTLFLERAIEQNKLPDYSFMVDDITGLPIDESYNEIDLPQYLKLSIDNMKDSWYITDHGKKDSLQESYWCDLNASINSAENDEDISRRQATYLRRKYLRIGD